MDWRFLLNAEIVAALIAAIIGLLGTLLTLSLRKRKARHDILFSELVKFRAALHDIKPAAVRENVIATGEVSPTEFACFLENFKIGDDMYLEQYRPYFDSDLQQIIDSAREPVISWSNSSEELLYKGKKKRFFCPHLNLY